MNARALPVVLCLAFLPAASPLSAGPIIANVDIDHFHISPNADGVSDSMIITYDLADTATSVHVLILESDSVTVVDSLLSGVAQGPSVTHSTSWDGTSSGGGQVADDDYFLFLRAVNTQAADSMYIPVSVDTRDPQVVITDRFPNPFAPGSPDPNEPLLLTVEFDVFDPYPSDKVNVRVDVIAPSGSTVETLLADTLLEATGSYTQTWDGAKATVDGIHSVRIVATDRAANSSDAQSSFSVDLDNPDIEITSLESNSSLPVVPDSLFGWTWDRNGIDSLFVRYSGGREAFEPVQSVMLQMDTVFFAVQLSDSVVEQKTYSLGFRAVDNVGREVVTLFEITLDSAPPPAPVLNQPVTPTRRSSVVLSGSVSSDANVMRIFRNNALIDTIFPNRPVAPEFPYELTLVPGENRIYAVAVDAAGNASARSNEVTVVFDSSPGLLIDQPFVAGDAFQINLDRPARVTLRIYDLSGNLVDVLDHATPSTLVTIAWDGLNGDREPVNKGPLVVVAKIDYETGAGDVFREIFLFQP